ncbi:HAD-superfamily hydrolase, subfamily IA, variant 1 [Metallosphaera sedula]|uniref:HAD-superfamily hydrolase, subfamily IA, variant 1 n=4 Tax=Metallosphaera TaxID=41980 RepID=A4YEA4_METS5|nr:HAD-superfamily hydrolase, subfamily IA, variant 1 [Metallosphaera sedula DSM 5348]AIM26743.1 HAD-superfamily hydrolase, subfamily IA, variant 1 [Metallosphaera sedula]QCO29706.1 HAD family hydrolase [Metallosphaera prunae]
MKAMILDLDGTLATTALLHKEAWELAMKRLGINANVNLDLLMGKRTLDIAKTLAGERYQELFEVKNDIFDELVARKAMPLPCAREMVERARSKGYSIAVVTSSLRRSASKSLGAIGVTPDLLIAGDDVEKGKPDPFPVVLALQRLRALPEVSVGVGDTLHDFHAFKGAGLGRIFILKGELGLDLSWIASQGAALVDSPCNVIKALDL